MNFKNAYDYLLNFQSQSSRNTSRIMSQEDSQFFFWIKIQLQKY
ncbi:unnamed protein product [Paramecium sonneborni]|uniref:Uncharacterized protein n=1 Tax=Paramecium sonneborni TaxID=65129 RepID=A0A8S1MUI0_9CILI|nr:unnamed protein product [Paramecium sonneborni]